MTEQTEPQFQQHDLPPKVTATEGLLWALAGLGFAVCVIAVIILMNAGYRDDTSGALAWIGVGQWVAGIAFVPAALLTGIRYLMPVARAYFAAAPGR